MADAELNVMLSGLSLDAILESSGNVLHITLDGTGISATASVTASAFSNSTLEDVTSAGSVSVKAQASLSKGLGDISAMAFGEIYTGINSPYEDIVSWTGHPLSGSRVRVRTGNLRGIFGVNGEFGIYAGSGWDEKSGLPPAANSQYIRLGNHTNEFHNVPVKLYDNGSVTIQLEPTSPSFAMGNPLPTGYNTGTGLWQGKDTDGTYKWRVGNPSGSNLSWNGTNLLLQNASLDISGSNVHIALGNPPPTSKTSGTGIWMDNSGIYGLHNNVKQVYIDTATGIFYSGAGTVSINEAGANIVIGEYDEDDHFTGIELNSTGLYGKVTDDIRFALANTGVPFLKLGTGEKDVDLTGIQIDSNEMVGQQNGVDQAVFSADGSILAGRGDIIIDGEGIKVETLRNAIQFREAGVRIGALESTSINVSEDPLVNKQAIRLSSGKNAENLVYNGSFDQGLDGWTVTNFAFLDSSNPYSPPNCAILLFANQTIECAIESSFFNVKAGGKYRLSYMSRFVTYSLIDSLNAWAQITFYDENEQYKGSTLEGSTVTSEFDIWYKTSATFTVPADAVKAKIKLTQPISAVQLYIFSISFDDIEIVEIIEDETSIELYNDEIQVHGNTTFSNIPLLPASNPTSDNQIARKAYVDTKVSLTDNETIAGVKSFSAIPILPSSNPTSNYQAAPKIYVDGAYTRANTRTLIINCFLEKVAITADDVTPVRIMTIPIELNNAVLINADAAVYEPSTSGLPEFRLYNITNSENILSTNITIDTGELNSYTATTQPVIDDDEKVVSTGDRIAMFVKTAGTGTEGLDIILTFMVPL